jgi:DegV family protein with EDD domain
LVHKRRVAVVVDSSSCLPKRLLEEHEIFVVPHELIVEGKVYRDGVDIEPSEFYQLLLRNERLPTTSAPKPASFLEAFEKASERALSILCITLSPNFSATYESARVAKDMARTRLPGLPIRVLDSRAAAGAEGFVALEAARAALRGLDLEGVSQRAQELIPRVNLLAFLDTLYFLAKSGRVPRIAALAASVLGVRPLTELKLGEARLLERPRSRARAMERLLGIMKGRVGTNPVHVNVMHTNCPQDAEELRRRVEAEFRCVELFVSEFTPVMGAHLGPGLLGLAFYADG